MRPPWLKWEVSPCFYPVVRWQSCLYGGSRLMRGLSISSLMSRPVTGEVPILQRSLKVSGHGLWLEAASCFYPWLAGWSASVGGCYIAIGPSSWRTSVGWSTSGSACHLWWVATSGLRHHAKLLALCCLDTDLVLAVISDELVSYQGWWCSDF